MIQKRLKLLSYSSFYIIFLFIISSCSFVSKDISWISIKGEDFLIRNKKFKFLGANSVYLVFYDELGLNREEAIKSAKDNNIKVLRIFLDWGWGSFSDYDEIISLASKYNIYLIFTLTDCCCSSGQPNKNEYFQRHAPYCNPLNKESIKAFKKRIKEIILHKDSVNKKLYRDKPIIFAWDIANELEFWHFDIFQVRKWISDIARYIKKLDPNHLITITLATSTKDFDNSDSLYELFNISELDYLSFSFYPLSKEYDEESLKDYKERINLRVKNISSFKKPVVMQEFGFSTSGKLNFELRNNPDNQHLYYSVLKEGTDSAFRAGVKGVLFWGWGIKEEINNSMWWRYESHNPEDKDFVNFLKKYKIP